jgi:regulator of PEP synthase PpsR (kinase-PPPase family)
MSFNFLDPSNVDSKMFHRCVSIISDKDGLELHMLNDAVMIQYEKDIDDFLSFLISVGEHLEEYEKCNQLIIQQKKYKKWLTVNLETAKSIAKLLTNLKLKHDNKEND